MNETVEKILELLDGLGVPKASDASEDLVMDSLQRVMLLVMIEEIFEIELDESDMDPFKLITVRDISELVARYERQKEESGEMQDE